MHMRMRMPMLRVVALLLLATPALVACGGDSAGDDGTISEVGDSAEADTADVQDQDTGSCYTLCIDKGSTDEECSWWCGDDGKDTTESGATFDPLPDDGATGTYTVTFDHDGIERVAIVHVPASYTGASTPILLTFHGFGGTAEDHMAWADFRDLADSEGFVVAYPQGSLLDGSPHWNSAAPSADNKSDADDFGYVDKLLDTIGAAYALDDNRVYAAGFSNGGMMSFGLACYRTDRIAAIASVSGAMLDDIGVACMPAHPTSVMTLHGTNDPVIAYNGGGGAVSVQETIDYWTDVNQITGAPEETSTAGSPAVDSFVYTGGALGTEVHHHRVVEGEHEWFKLDLAGADTQRLIWDFLSRFGRDGAL